MPFEPKGCMLEARAELRAAMRGLEPRPGDWLSATYVSPTADLVDLENVLFYNVGPGVFSHLTARGLSAVRMHAPPKPSPNGREYAHYNRYAVEPYAPIDESGAQLSFPLPPKAGEWKPHDVWWYASRANVQGLMHIGGRFQLNVEIPEGLVPGLTGLMKPLLDGYISALHPGAEVDTRAVDRVAKRTGWDASEIIARLENPTAPVLAPRTVLRSYREFVRWDPADDLCDGVSLHPGSRDDLCRVWVRDAEAADGAARANAARNGRTG